MSKSCLATSAVVLLAVAIAGSANAQGGPPPGGALQPGTEFPAAPVSKGGFSFSAPSNVLPPPGAAAPEVAPAPEPAKKKRRKRRS